MKIHYPQKNQDNVQSNSALNVPIFLFVTMLLISFLFFPASARAVRDLTIKIDSHSNNSTVSTGIITITGKIYSRLPAHKLKVRLGTKTINPTPSGAHYKFKFEKVWLVKGKNIFKVITASHRGCNFKKIKLYYEPAGSDESIIPEITILSPEKKWLKKNHLKVSGYVKSHHPIKKITVNGKNARLNRKGAVTWFKRKISFPDTSENDFEVKIIAIDNKGKSADLTHLIHYDSVKPEIIITTSGLEKRKNTVFQNPFLLEGEIIEENLASLTINNQPVDFTPGQDSISYFSNEIELTPEKSKKIQISAIDLAGNITKYRLFLKLAGKRDIEVLLPLPDSEVYAQGDQADIDISIRMPAMKPTYQVKARIKGARTNLDIQEDIASGIISIPAEPGQYTLHIRVTKWWGWWAIAKSKTTFYLSLIPPPVIDTHPIPVQINQGQSASFSISATGGNSYQWLKDGAIIENTTEPLYYIPSTTSADCGAYSCLVSNQSGEVESNSAELTVLVIFPENTTPVSNGLAKWENGKARLTWANAGLKYKIFRGITKSTISEIAIIDQPFYPDSYADYNHTWYYQIASIQRNIQPCTGQEVLKTGPLSPIITLTALPGKAKGELEKGQQTDDKKWSVVTGSDGKSKITGIYDNIFGSVQVTASKDGQIIIGTGEDGKFSIELSEDGDWEIEISDGVRSVNFSAFISSDSEPPSLDLNTVPSIVQEKFVTISGYAEDSGSGMENVKITNNQYPTEVNTINFTSSSFFTYDIKLKNGENKITIIAQDKIGNETVKTLIITAILIERPEIIILSPVNNSILTSQPITVTGTIKSEHPPEKIRLILNNNVSFPVGDNRPYTFSFPNIKLNKGSNIIDIKAEFPDGNLNTSVSVTYQENIKEAAPPQIISISPASGTFFSESSCTISGLVTGESEIETVTINNHLALLTIKNDQLFFTYELDFPDQEEGELGLEIKVTDSTGKSTSQSHIIGYDRKAPEISFSNGLVTAPVVVSIDQSPYQLTGQVAEKYLAGMSIGNKGIPFLFLDDNVNLFDEKLLWSSNPEKIIEVKAWDRAGNMTTQTLILFLENHLIPEIINPELDKIFYTSEEMFLLNIVTRVPGISDSETVIASIDNQFSAELNRSGSTAVGNIEIPAVSGEYQLDIDVVDGSGTFTGRTTTTFELINIEEQDCGMKYQKPVINAVNVDPESEIVFNFNKSVNHDNLQINITETASGEVYKLGTQGIIYDQINHSNKPVTGSLVFFPDNSTVSFNSHKGFINNSQISVEIICEDIIINSAFSIRPQPTLIHGVVLNPLQKPIADISVEIPKLGRKTMTDNNGNFSIGIEDEVDKIIPSGNYRFIINNNLANKNYATFEFDADITRERFNRLSIIKLPILNSQTPFAQIISGQEEAILSGGNLILDLSQVTLSFQDGRNQGNIHTQLQKMNEFMYSGMLTMIPEWMYLISPGRINVTGNIGLTFKVPKINNNYDHLANIGERVILLGLSRETLMIMPIGVGKVNLLTKQIISQGRVNLKSLDYLGYKIVGLEKQSAMELYADDKINIQTLIGILEGE
jgi:hypothetical protein